MALQKRRWSGKPKQHTCHASSVKGRRLSSQPVTEDAPPSEPYSTRGMA